MVKSANEFEKFLAEQVPHHAPFRGAIIDVCDTAYIAQKWFVSHSLKYTAADVVAMTSLIITRERELKAEQEGKGGHEQNR